ncbi:cuticle protein 7-like [Macrobrachium nipponense]|uniref:cuticle protein 7-like n=1 Tax=Macrobrachium nipponense TaxID=159736 RepID=UPI0030C82E42
MFKIACTFIFLGMAMALPRPDSPPVYAPPAPSYSAPHQPTYQEEESKKPYTFDYGVKDDYTGASFGHKENADGQGSVTGSYSVALPDGRIQTVNYIADHHNGFHADVTYEGQAVYPEQQQPSYQPAPAAYAPPAPSPYA